MQLVYLVIDIWVDRIDDVELMMLGSKCSNSFYCEKRRHG